MEDELEKKTQDTGAKRNTKKKSKGKPVATGAVFE